MKQCKECGQEKDESCFTYHKTTKDNLTQKCKDCISAYNKAYRTRNKEKIQQQDREYAAANAEKARERTKNWNRENQDRKRAYDKSRYEKFKHAGNTRLYYGNVDPVEKRLRAKMWRKMNPGKVCAQTAKRRAAVLQATPGWAEYDSIVLLYEQAQQLSMETGVKHQVDHIVPLNNELVCGLHCLANLQILTATENNTKRNTFEI